MRKHFKIGRYQLGYRMVNLWAMPDESGGWYSMCGSGEESQIRVGMNYTSDDKPFAILMHEVIEMCADDLNALYKPTNCFEDGASDSRFFHYNHNQHTEIASRVAWFIQSSMEDFKKAYRKTRRRK